MSAPAPGTCTIRLGGERDGEPSPTLCGEPAVAVLGMACELCGYLVIPQPVCERHQPAALERVAAGVFIDRRDGGKLKLLEAVRL